MSRVVYNDRQLQMSNASIYGLRRRGPLGGNSLLGALCNDIYLNDLIGICYYCWLLDSLYLCRARAERASYLMLRLSHRIGRKSSVT